MITTSRDWTGLIAAGRPTRSVPFGCHLSGRAFIDNQS
jgi:hypothetical protein